jgi:hypothetical protein
MWLTQTAFFFPGVQPGWLGSWFLMIATDREKWSPGDAILCVTVLNALFYAWVASKIFKAKRLYEQGIR